MTTHLARSLAPAFIKLGPRYWNHPGPYAIGDDELALMIPGLQPASTVSAPGNHVKGELDGVNLEFVIRIATSIAPRLILEVGTYRGRTTRCLAESCQDAHVVTIDVPRECLDESATHYGTDEPYIQTRHDIGKYLQNWDSGGRVRQLLCDSRSEQCQSAVDEIRAGRTVDLAFIDASHDFHTVRDNFENLVLPRLSEHGIAIFDDYARLFTHIGVTHYLTRKAHDDGYLFYWYAPDGRESNCVLFINDELGKGFASHRRKGSTST